MGDTDEGVDLSPLADFLSPKGTIDALRATQFSMRELTETIIGIVRDGDPKVAARGIALWNTHMQSVAENSGLIDRTEVQHRVEQNEKGEQRLIQVVTNRRQSPSLSEGSVGHYSFQPAQTGDDAGTRKVLAAGEEPPETEEVESVESSESGEGRMADG